MPSYSNSQVIMVYYPFTNLSGAKIRPGIVVSAPHVSRDLFVVPLTSKVARLLPGEFALNDWKQAGLNVASAVKRGIFAMDENLVVRSIGKLSDADAARLEQSLRDWLNLH
jgi:mRNA interferase MazF